MHSQFSPTPNLLCKALRPIPTSLATYSECLLLFINTTSYFISLPFLANAHYYLCTKPCIVFLIFCHNEFHFPLQVRWPISYSLCRLDYCSRICVCEYSVYTNVNVNVSISGIALNQRSVQQASVDIRASSTYEQEKASLFF